MNKPSILEGMLVALGVITAVMIVRAVADVAR